MFFFRFCLHALYGYGIILDTRLDLDMVQSSETGDVFIMCTIVTISITRQAPSQALEENILENKCRNTLLDKRAVLWHKSLFKH